MSAAHFDFFQAKYNFFSFFLARENHADARKISPKEAATRLKTMGDFSFYRAKLSKPLDRACLPPMARNWL